MKRRRTSASRMLSLLLVIAMVLTLIPVSVFAAGETRTIYLNAGGSSLWDQAGAWFDAWVWGSSQADAWYTFADTDDDGTYEVQIPADATGMKILRKNPASTAHDWEKWNETGDLAVGTDNLYTITGWGANDGTWSTYTYVEPAEPMYIVAGMADLCGDGWNPANLNNKMTKNASGIYEKVYTDVAAGTYEFKVTKDGGWENCWPSSNCSLTVTEAGSTVTITFDAATKTVSATAEAPVQPAPDPEPEPEGVTVYCINSNQWAAVSAHAWIANGTGTTWPGNPMTKTGQSVNGFDVYSITFTTAYENVVFNNTAGSQTADLELKNGQYYDLATNTWYASLKDVPSSEPAATDYYLVGWINDSDYSGNDYKFENGKLTVTFPSNSYVVVKDGSGDWYLCETYCEGTSATLTKGHSEKMFVAGGTEVTFFLSENDDGTLTLSYITGTGEGGSGGGGDEGDETTDVHYAATFHFANTLNWATVNLYTWLGTGTQLTGSWPGTATTVKDGYYTATVEFTAPVGQSLNFIFNNGSTQTLDLAVPAGDFQLDGEVYKAEKWVVLTTQENGKYNAAIVNSPESIVISPVVDGNTVTFNYGDNSATSVSVAGSFNGWSATATPMTKNAEGIWTATVSDLAAGDYTYKFVVNGENWTIDPMNSNVATDADGNQNSAFYILTGNDETDDNKVTVRIHYSRVDGNYDGWNLWVWGSNMGGHQVDFDSADPDGAQVATIVLEDARAHQNICFKERLSVEGNDWKDQGASDRSIDLSTVVSGTIDYYLPEGNCVFGDDVVRKNKVSSVALDYDNGAITITTVQAITDPEAALKLMKGDEEIPVTMTNVGGKCSLTLPENMQLNLAELYKYQILFEGASYAIAMDAVYASNKFAAEYTYTGNDLGASYYDSGTTFRLWAPTAEEVSVQLYATGSDAESGAAKLGTYAMSKDVNGTWIVTLDGDLNGTYYTYLVKVNGETVEANDPYSVTTGVNGQRSMVLNLDATDPDGWYDDSNPNPVTSQTNAIIYELHVRDFSIDASSGVSTANRGKFLAFTEEGTTVHGAGTTATGIDYLKDLGITHLHLLPIYDYASVDETTCSNFNWGYDPQNYNVPEGSYSTNPYDGAVRVNEMKQMVMALHDNGISVVMDVVYNHVYDASTFSFNQIVPGYFSRVDSNRSGCGNDTASEREMVRKYIVESVLYWTEEYHIDGFRFDLVGLLDTETVNQIVEEVHAVRPDVIFYGEGWDMDDTNKEPGTEMAKQGNASKTPGFAYFSDSMRNGLGGGNDGKTTGFASGAANGSSMVTEWLGNPWWTSDPQQVIQYASCHDNYTLADKIILSTGKSTVDDTVIKMNNLAAAFYMTAQGVPFIHAGEELLREKINDDGSRNHNSYNSSDAVNHIDWTDVEKYAETSAYYQGLIAFRKAHPALRYSTATLVKENVQTREASSNLIVMRIDGNAAGDDDILVIFNASSNNQTVTLPDGEWEIYVQGAKAGTTVLGTATGSVSVAGITTTVLTKEDQGVDEDEPLGASPEKTIYFSNNKYWSQVYAYAWTGNQSMLGDWPGTRMTYVETNDYGEDVYCITLPASESGIEGVIFSDGSGNQTVDIQPGVDGTGYYCTDPDDQGHYQVGTYTYRAPQVGSEDEYYLHGYIGNVDYFGTDYKFDEDGKLTTTFSADAYVYVVNGVGTTYMTDGWLGAVKSAVLKNVDEHTLTGDKWDKLMIPGGTEVTFTLVVNDDDTVTLSYATTATSVVDESGIQDGVTLHCWNWSFAEIEANMATIAAQGYTAIQTSPIQPLKEPTNLSGHTVGGNWWVYYQPIDFVITTDSGNALGTKAELESMIKTAHEYGIQVIVDVVVNHMANQTCNNLSDQIPEYLLKDEFWHDVTTNTTNWNDRYDVTQHCMSGLPDLNTANKELQNIILEFLKDCVDAGVDGFRFDAAKHIETPDDNASFASDFWPTVVGGAETYAQETYSKDLYIYGELLDETGGVSLSAYTQYMAITDNSWGNALRGSIAADKAALAAGYNKAVDPSVLVLWAESHDTFATDDQSQSSAAVSEADIIKTWALVAARADAMGLYFARPESMDQALGIASVTGWANPDVKAINLFHNAFAGQEEVVSNENGISYVERGTAGAVLVNVAGTSADVSVTAHAMADGIYVDQISGNTFTVANGKITGKFGTSGIAVVYNHNDASLGHTEIPHDAEAPTCNDVGWDAYVSCADCGYSTYAEKAALGHNEVPHAAKAPTCTEKGWDAYVTCSRCDYSTYVEKAALGHDEVSHAAKAPTCTEKGWDAYVTCSRCDHSTYAEIPATGHTHKAVVTAPTCTAEGYTTYTCACGDSYVADKVASKGHTPGAAATCTTKQTCTVCGAELAPSNGHDWKAATCTAPMTCATCGATEGKALGHSWKAATCTTPKTCATCGTTEGKALGHSWKAATCTTPKTCATCGTTEGKALGHSWKAATCTAPMTCATCGTTEGKALGHNWKAATCTAPKTCATCGATEGKALGHSWKAATCTAPMTCATCGATEGKALGHSWKAATCTAPMTCATCDATEGKALGHSWKAATCTTPKFCVTCKTTVGRPVPHIYSDGVDGTCDVCGGHREISEKRTVMHMFRMYDPNSGEHFYTGSEVERDNLVAVGWHYEGVGFTFSMTTGAPVYRLYDPVYGEHLYTMDVAERDTLMAAGWKLEGVAFNSAYDTEVPQYRLHNPNTKRGAYHFTASVEERDYLISLGWEYQGIGFYSSWR